jgi:hypothetical protein
MGVVGLCIVLVVRGHADPERAAVSRSTRVKDPVLWVKIVAFYTLLVLCFTIPSGWTQQVLEYFEVRKDVLASAETDCGERGRPHS